MSPSPSQSLTIALAIHRLSAGGGQEHHCRRMAEALRLAGHQVTIFTSDGEGDGVETLPKPPSARTNHARLQAFAEAFARKAAGHDRRVGFQAMPSLDVLFLGDMPHRRMRPSLLRRLSPRYRTMVALERSCLGPAALTKILCLAETQRDAYVALYPDAARRIVVLSPTVEPSIRRPPSERAAQRAPERAELGLSGQQTAWLWIGTQPETKGLDRVLEALAGHPSAVLLICGVDPHSTKLTPHLARARALGLSDRVRLVGYADRVKLGALIAAADLLAHPARVDVTGTVILEALVNGLPVVASAVCGYSVHVTRADAGVVVAEPFDQTRFSAALGQVGGPDQARFSANGFAAGADPALYAGLDEAVAAVIAPPLVRG